MRPRIQPQAGRDHNTEKSARLLTPPVDYYKTKSKEPNVAGKD
jgi:hypothetical protein